MITTRILLPDDFGKASMFTLALNVSMIFILFGTDQSFIRFFYEEKEENRRGLLYNCLALPSLLLVLTSAILLMFYERISLALFNEINLVVVLFLVIGIATQVYYRFAILVVRMQQKGNLFSILEIVSRILNIVVLIALYITLGRKYEIIVYSTVIANLILFVIAILNEKKFWKFQRIFNKNLLHTKKEIIIYGMPLVLTVLITWLFQSFDKIALKNWSTYSEIGLYAAAFKVVALLNVFQTTFTTFWTPVALEKFHENEEDHVFYANVSKFITLIMLFVAILSITGKDIIIFLLGKNYSESAKIVPFLIFMPTMYTISETTVVGINFYKKTNWHIFIAAISCAINIFGNWLLVPKFGAVGAAISTAISYIIFFLLRTKISLMYFKVDYELKKMFFSITVVFAYAITSIRITNFIYSFTIGIIALLIHAANYHNEVKRGYSLIKDYIKLRKNKFIP
jgi:O-antigen/teichoic acid export membrane protein